jgi:hypothetical protein
MKTISNALRAHFGLDCTTLAVLWRIVRTDGTVMGFTTHDLDIVYLGVTYSAATGLANSASDSNSDLSVDNVEVTGFLDSSAIDESDVLQGLYDYAVVQERVVNWSDLTQGDMLVRLGTIGHVKMKCGLFTAELRGLTQFLSTLMGAMYGPVCRAELGNAPAQTISACAVAGNVPPWIWGIPGTNGSHAYAFAGDTNFGGVYPTIGIRGLEAGWVLSISASGTVADSASPSVEVGPDGDPDYITADHESYPYVAYPAGFAPGARLGRGGLVGAFCTDTGVVVSVISIGHGGIFTVPTGGKQLQLGINDGNIGGNTGAFAVVIQSGSGLRWNCRVNIALYSQGGSVVASPDPYTIEPASGLLMVGSSTPAAAAGAGWFDNGLITFTSGALDGRSFEIKTWDGTSFKMFLPLPVQPCASPADTFTVTPGCNHLTQDCANKFSNIVNFRGEPFIPGADLVLNYPNATG